MSITINRKLILGVAAALALAVAAFVAIPRFIGAGKMQAAQTPEQAAVDFMRSFYTVDYRDKEQWLVGLKPQSTQSGYILIETTLAPTLWPKLTQAHTVTTADQVQVADAGLKAEGESALAGGSWQIRSVKISIAPEALWPAMTAGTFTANVLLVQQASEWKFGMFLADQDIALFARGKQP